VIEPVREAPKGGIGAVGEAPLPVERAIRACEVAARAHGTGQSRLVRTHRLDRPVEAIEPA
jgi:hypothetical protein